MALDSVFLGALVQEVRPLAEGAAVERIFQPAQDEIILTLRAKGGGGKLAFSLSPNFPGIYFTDTKRENPQTPPMFCMLLRKHLQGARIIGVEQQPGERIVLIRLSCLSELGDYTQKLLIAELMGRRTNLILTQEDGLIIDCLKRVTPDDPTGRRLLPGLFYEYPKPMEKPYFLLLSEDELIGALQKELETGAPVKAVTRALGGISPLVARELCCRAGVDPDSPVEAANALIDAVVALREDILAGRYEPTLISDGPMPQDMCYIDIAQYASALQTERFETFSELLNTWYVRRASIELLRRLGKDLRKTATSAREREARKLAARRSELAQCADRDELRRDGELIISNIYRLSRGESVLEAPDYSQEGAPMRKVRLDPLKTPQQNAAAYFKEYRKAGTAIEHLTALIAAGQEQIEYLDSVLDELERAKSPAQLQEIRQELEFSGVLKRRGAAPKQKKPASEPPYKVMSPSGFEILIGHNNRQNDELTFHLARKDDLWLHVKDYPGSHVIVRSAGVQPDEQTLMLAASLAAEHSQAQGHAAVDVTQVRNVKKTPGSKPGMVIYTNFHTITASSPRQDP